MSEPRTIKKYPNRRLYDTEESRYITLADIRRLVLEKVDFVVIDKKSGQDITRAILLQVISEQEQTGEPIMSRDFLSHVIRSYGGAMQGFVGSYLEQSIKLFMNQQQQMRDRVRNVVGVDPVGLVTDIAQKNYTRWKSVQEEISRILTRRPDEDEEEEAPPPRPAGKKRARKTSQRSGK
ncbi:MAG: polyhydroxyalkanoate synthesis repressor PhaR [Gammaproteobacteria bacterium]|jgi:polyhydroxyalkanoate synthesis repressor PhaR